MNGCFWASDPDFYWRKQPHEGSQENIQNPGFAVRCHCGMTLAVKAGSFSL